MNPDDTNTNPLDAAYAKLAEMRPDPVLRDATPAPWATTNHEGGNEL